MAEIVLGIGASHTPDDGEVLRPLRVVARREVAVGIHEFELRADDGDALPGFTPGSHVMVVAPNGLRRNYSLCNAPHETGFYRIAVKRDAAGRGGSVSMADDLRVGDLLPTSTPRNHFEMSARAKRFLFIAGGIGITPILCMMRHLAHVGNERFQLIYLARDAASAAYAQEIADTFGARATLHFDQGDPARALDLWPMLETPTDAHIYCCGPTPLMDAVRDMSGHWPSGSVHFESFGAQKRSDRVDEPFVVQLASGRRIDVARDETILEALRRCGVRVPSSCEAGTCGSCRTPLVEGEADHRDIVLGEAEQGSQIMVCVSRARSPVLVLGI